jgi:hypothetical protein
LETKITNITQASKILVSGISGGEEFEAEFDFLINAAAMEHISSHSHTGLRHHLYPKILPKEIIFQLLGKHHFKHLSIQYLAQKVSVYIIRLIQMGEGSLALTFSGLINQLMK